MHGNFKLFFHKDADDYPQQKARKQRKNESYTQNPQKAERVIHKKVGDKIVKKAIIFENFPARCKKVCYNKIKNI